MSNITAFLSYILILNLSPGANTILSMTNASQYKFKRSVTFNLGIGVGVFFVMLLCSIFSLTLLEIAPSIVPVMKWLGAGYILWLSWKTLKNEPMQEATEKKEENLFMNGMLLQFINPNTFLYGLSTFSMFITPYYQSKLILLFFCLLLSLFATIATGCWTVFGFTFQKVILSHGKIMRIIMAALLVYCAYAVLFS
ncbi:MAG: LysE family transporter [Clostridium sp.]|uniref:LysE family transporter n=1 Tax=Clostridium sp. TaxID=1506 RepID=UPI002913BD1D|nr:LysE family transporter [Clostridium sp.]MDU7337982.1 LysE family transporter [Clostridium sp.]